MHDVQLIFASSCAAFFAGTLDSIGGGGGIITLPTLMALGLPPHMALGTNKAQSTFGGISGTLSFWRAGYIAKERSLPGFASAFLGGLLGALIVSQIPAEPLRFLIPILLLAATAILVARPYLRLEQQSAQHPVLALWLIGLAIGTYDGFFGPATGSLMIIALTVFLGDELLRASANSKVMNTGSNLAALMIFMALGKIDWLIALPMGVLNVLGQWVGTKLAVKVGDRLVRLTVLCVLAVIMVKTLWSMR